MKNSLKAWNLNINTFDKQVFENRIELETKKTLAAKLKYSVSFINKLMKQKKIPYLKNGRSVRFVLGDVIAALQNGSSL